ncbi:CehA/McbA family metallohydrolase [Bauldia sp.]|uniref:CehA/McbA family metallohydrolase n=1 Tax=Bauldia sp. TaxID=2575872 RepID=UPI003BAA7E02
MTPAHLVADGETTITVPIAPEQAASGPYVYIPFIVPAGVTRLDLRVVYERTRDFYIDLGIFDPSATNFPTSDGFRGWSGGARDRFFIATDAATPGYVAGPIPAGTWQVILGLIGTPPAGFAATFMFATSTAARPPKPPVSFPEPRRSEPGWYKGDLHAHTFHSDAAGAPELLHRTAAAKGLDFLAITDHNTTTAWDYFGPASSPDLVFLKGMEVTTKRGHANAFGLPDWVDFRMVEQDDPHKLADAVGALGALLSINHDKPPIPWLHTMPRIDCMEVWQHLWLALNDQSLALYDKRLATGARITAIGGSDYHQPDRFEPDNPFGLASPTTVLYLDELSVDGILAGLRSGRGYITEAPDGPHLEITVNDTPMGGTATRGETQTVTANVNGAAGDQLVLVGEQGEVAHRIIPDDRSVMTLKVSGADTFLRAEIQAEASTERLVNLVRDYYRSVPEPRPPLPDPQSPPVIRRALSNPVYFEP